MYLPKLLSRDQYPYRLDFRRANLGKNSHCALAGLGGGIYGRPQTPKVACLPPPPTPQIVVQCDFFYSFRRLFTAMRAGQICVFFLRLWGSKLQNFLQNPKISPKMDAVPKSYVFFSNVTLGPSTKIVGQIIGVFSFGVPWNGTLRQVSPPPPTGG